MDYNQGDITQWIVQASIQYGLDPVTGVAQLLQEGSYDRCRTSSAGAKGVAQFMPGTAAQYGLVDRCDAYKSIDAWGRHMRDLVNQFGRIDYALAGYNAGPGNVKKYGGVPPFKETQTYVKNILGYRQNEARTLIARYTDTLKNESIVPGLIVAGVAGSIVFGLIWLVKENL